MHILLTGAAGFIGSHVLDALLARGDRVTAIDSLAPFYPRAIKEANIAAARRYRTVRLIESDIRDLAALQALAAPYDAIIHLAACAGVRPSIADPLLYQHVNVAGTQNVLECARQWGVPQFVFASSSSVYGVNPDTPWSEGDHVLLPISPYASTKVSGELLGHVYSHLHGIRFLGLRFFTVYGPRQRPDLAIHKFARLILAGCPIPVYGDGSTSRDYTFVADIVSGILSAISYTGSPYEIINLGNNCTVSLTDMIRSLEEALGRKAVIDWQPAQPGDVPITWADIAKARRLLGYDPKTSFRDGVRAFAQWLFDTDTGLAQSAPASPVATVR